MIGAILQLIFMAIGLMVALVIWMVRLTVMLAAAPARALLSYSNRQ